ncbi:hypothetical protein AAFF_G00184090 [Aldrovandia affinis]|uniref:Uncharacterized protein n=1 Tax=Aldrovandia affinis TaxID=143900 RepID=A0AAD7VX31_9TELE|nr:hypothetical protein AAFF_G00184090 [Aldrovandia affinis]
MASAMDPECQWPVLNRGRTVRLAMPEQHMTLKKTCWKQEAELQRLELEETALQKRKLEETSVPYLRWKDDGKTPAKKAGARDEASPLKTKRLKGREEQVLQERTECKECELKRTPDVLHKDKDSASGKTAAAQKKKQARVPVTPRATCLTGAEKANVLSICGENQVKKKRQ